ncbi:flagellar rod assembly protein/muramidase FlgJ [Catenovulum agarivorans DS-2]|uniref:Peptidoglycan hydrolase FlgJ n=1 Tax=Catenovulum agarivorans DS-2 TaxID=1328313 RepID=W7QPY9_9ALTE|nr:flagellar assembly peptidoglycan hydrolase FlgJ [Catenovulum agarivorans]EWH09953.1 flagellar rod assembly protein/muramidase FlgJ [Catenovulum agarivorans DS-2]
MDKLDQAQFVQDFAGLNGLREAAQSNPNDQKALRKAAEHFESIFMKMMLQSMRQAEEVLEDKDSPFNSQETKFFRGMMDDQLAVDLSSTGALGLADLIVEQLSPGTGNITAASITRNDGQLSRAQAYPQANQFSARAAEQPQANQTAVEQSTALPVERVEFANKQDFVDKLLPYATMAAEKLGISPIAMIGQAALETGWGQKMMQKFDGSNALNFFGIKADGRWDGDKTTVSTLEYKNGVAHQERAQFRAYSNIAESMQDYADFILNSPRYQQAVEVGKDVKQYFSELQKAGYATDPNYADKIMSVLKDSVFDSARDMLKF